MSCERSASSAAWSESARRIGSRLGGERVDPRDPADGRDRGAAVGDAEVGQALAGGEDVVEVHHRLAHAHEDAVVDAARCGGSAAPGRGSRRRSGCARSSSARSRRTCRSAGSPTARTGRASAGRRGSASARPRPAGRRGCAKSALTVPSRGVRLVLERQRRERHLGGQPRAQRGRQVGHRLVARRAARRPTPTPGARGSAARPRRPACAARSSRSIARQGSFATMRLAKHLAHAGVASRRAAEQLVVGRARDGRRRRRSPTPRATSPTPSAIAVDGEPVGVAAARRSSTRCTSRPASSRPRATRTAARPSSTSSPTGPAPLPGRPPRRRHAPA